MQYPTLRSVPAVATDAWTESTSLLSKRTTTGNATIGRENELEELAKGFAEGRRLQSISGAPGVGKTRLVREYISRHKGDWSEIRFLRCGTWKEIDLRANQECDLSFPRSRAKMTSAERGESMRETGERSDPILNLSAKGRTLIVLDSFEAFSQQIDVIENALARTAELAFLVQSPWRLWLWTMPSNFSKSEPRKYVPTTKIPPTIRS
jgi:AAA+ ATPase superfamily predicted ATPase